jgi:Xaa-Pro aminopeptidase
MATPAKPFSFKEYAAELLYAASKISEKSKSTESGEAFLQRMKEEYFTRNPEHREAWLADREANPKAYEELGKRVSERINATRGVKVAAANKEFMAENMPRIIRELGEDLERLDRELGIDGGTKQHQLGRSSLPAMAATAAAGALIAGAAQASQSPEGQRFVEGAKAAAKAAAEGALPGVTETDMCKKVGKATGAVGAATGAIVLGGAGAAGGLVASPVGSAALGAAGVAAGGTLGNEIGEKLGEGACNMARNVFKGKASTVQAAEASAAQPKEAAASPKTPNHGTAASRG